MSEQPAASIDCGRDARRPADRPADRRPRATTTSACCRSRAPGSDAAAPPRAWPRAAGGAPADRRRVARQCAHDRDARRRAATRSARARRAALDASRARALADDVVLRHAARRPRRGHRRRSGAGRCRALMKAGFLLSLTEPALVAAGAARCSTPPRRSLGARQRRASAPTSTRCTRSLDGDWHGAGRAWDALLRDHPRDALALQWAHLFDFYRGDAAGLRERVAARAARMGRRRPAAPVRARRCTPSASRNPAATPQAEEAGRRALAGAAARAVGDPRGRPRDGDAGPPRRGRGAGWRTGTAALGATGNGFAGHLGWHEALFALEALDDARGAARLRRATSAPTQIEITLQRVDAASLLWRLRLLGADVGDALARARRRLARSTTRRAGQLGVQRPARAARADRRRRDRRAARPGSRTSLAARRARRAAGTARSSRERRRAADARPARLRAPAARRRRRALAPLRARPTPPRRQPRAARRHRPDAARRGRATRPARRWRRALLDERASRASAATPLTRVVARRLSPASRLTRGRRRQRALRRRAARAARSRRRAAPPAAPSMRSSQGLTCGRLRAGRAKPRVQRQSTKA